MFVKQILVNRDQGIAALTSDQEAFGYVEYLATALITQRLGYIANVVVGHRDFTELLLAYPLEVHMKLLKRFLLKK